MQAISKGLKKFVQELNAFENDGAVSKHFCKETLKVVLGEALGYGPTLSEHIILDIGLILSKKVGDDLKLDDNTTQVLAEAVLRFEDSLEDVIFGEKVPKGYILMQEKSSGKKNDVSEKENFVQVRARTIAIRIGIPIIRVFVSEI